MYAAWRCDSGAPKSLDETDPEPGSVCFKLIGLFFKFSPFGESVTTAARAPRQVLAFHQFRKIFV